MRDSLLDALLAAGAVTRPDADRLRELPPRAGGAVAELTSAGIEERAVLEAASRVFGVPLLPDKWLLTPKPPARLPAAVETFVALRAAPVGTLKGQLCVVYAEPESVSSPAALSLPPHRAFLARAADVSRVLDLACSASGIAPPSLAEPPPLPSGAISALPLPHDAATVMDTPRLEGGGFDHLPTTEGEEENPIAPVAKSAPVPEPTLALAPDELPSPLAAARQAERSKPRGSGLDEARERALAALPRFRVRGVLGRGGMATVYLADDKGAEGEERVRVALKLMEPHLAGDETFVERFRREVRATSSLDHPNLVRTYDAGLEGDTLYMASEYVDGGTLRDLLVAAGPLPVALAAPVLLQALRGLAHAHDRGLVHRDLKPANLLLSTTGLVKVGDFGVAKSQTDNTLTQSGMLFGTPAYMSPEQAFGKPLDGRSDLFSLATLAYELLTGRNPYHHENMSTSLLMVSKVSARPIFEVCPTLPPLLEEVLSRMMERDRGQRFRDAHAAADALEPLVRAIEARHGDVLADAVREPRATALRLARAQAEEEVRRAQLLLADGDERAREAAFRFYKARRLDADNPASSSFLQLLVQRHGFTFDLDGDPALEELEEALAKKPDSPALLRRGADLMLARKNLLGAVAWMRRYLRAQRTDLHMKMALESILGADPLAPFSDGASAHPAALPVGERASSSPPFVLDGGDETAYVRARSADSPVAALSRRPLALFVAAAGVLGVLIAAPLLFKGDGENRADVDTTARASAGTASPDGIAEATVDPARAAARLERQRQKIAESRALVDEGHLAEAIGALDAAIAEDPGSDLAVDALLARARVYVNLRRMADARTDLEKVTQLVEDKDPRASAARELLSRL